MFRRNHVSKAMLLAFGGLALSIATSATAQTQRVEVTGSNIKRADLEGPQPVFSIKREDIERSGAATLNDLLSGTPVISGGTFNENTQSGNSFAPGTAAISLRGLGSQTTLVLLNGRRIANYGFAQNLNEGFVDLNSIPLNAVERIDILKDGASAVYGSDAIAGVVNVILRKDFTGVEVGTSFSTTTRGDGEETRASATLGTGNDRFNVMLMVDYYNREKINAGNRGFSKNADKRGDGPGARDVRSPTGNPGYWRGGTGNVNTPFSTCAANSIVPAASLGVGGGGNVCAYNFAPDNDLSPSTERIGGFGQLRFKLGKDVELFAEALLNSNSTSNSAAPTPAAFNIPANHPDKPNGTTFTGVAYRTVEAGLRLSTIDTESSRFVVGARGTLAGFDLEAAAMQAKSKTVNIGRNFIIQERAQEAFNGTLAGFAGQFYRVIDPSLNSPAMLAAIKIDPKRVGDSELNAVDLKLSRELFQMGGGMAAVAAGVESRKEEVSDTPDFRTSLLNPNRVTVAGSGGTAVVGSRKLNSAFAEFSLPVFKGFEAQVALRTDDYSDFGRANTPKLAMSFKPMKNLLLRAGMAKGFRAPSLAELYLGVSTSFPTVQDTPRCRAYQAGYGATDPRTVAVCGPGGNGASAQVRTEFQGSIASGIPLSPEKSESSSLGMVFDVTDNLSVSADVYYIDHKNRILSPTAAFILANANLFPGAIVRNDPAGDDIAIGAPGSLRGVGGDLVAGVKRTFFNASRQRTHGIDADATYRWNLGDRGRISAKTAFTYIGGLKRQLNPGQALVELADTYQFPRWRNTSSVTWAKGSWQSSLTLNTIGSYEDSFFVQNSAVRVKAMYTLDAQVQYSGIKNMRIVVGGRNITDEKPPFSNNDWQGFDTSTHSPNGASLYMRANYKF